MRREKATVHEDKARVIAMMFVAVILLSIGETLLAKAMKQSNDVTGGLGTHLRDLFSNRYFWIGVLLMATHFGIYSLALRWADLSFVLPLTALTYLCGALLAKYYLGEAVTPIRWVGAFVITLGVVLVGFGDNGPAHSSPEAKVHMKSAHSDNFK